MNMPTEINYLQTDEKYLTLDDISKYLQLPKATLYKYTSRNTTRLRLKGVRIGTLRFRTSDVDEWLKELKESN
jgi:excisionase family DNA binding protein